MAAASKGQNLLVPLIISCVVTLIMCITAALIYSDNNKLNAAVAAAETKAGNADKDKNNAMRQVAELKTRIGYDQLEYGSEADANSLLAKIKEDMLKFRDPANPNDKYEAPNYVTGIAQQDTRIKTLIAERDAKDADRARLGADVDAARNLMRNEVTTEKTATQAAVSDLKNEQEKFHQTLIGKEAEYDAVREQANLRAEEAKQLGNMLETERTNFQKKGDIFSNELKDLKDKVARTESRGTPVGQVVKTQYDTLNKQSYAFLDLGEEDRLPLQATFSIWSPDKNATPYHKDRDAGIEKDAETLYKNSDKRVNLKPRPEGGPKGYVEVLKVMGPHQSIGRVTMSSSLDPIAPGDLVLSAIWAPGEAKHFALAGRFDMTGKGTNDRQLLMELIKIQGGVLDAWVDDEGVIQPPGGEVTAHTSYFIKGTLPDPSDKSDLNASKYADAIGKAAALLEGESKKYTVQIMDQGKFYDYMGYKVHSRRYEMGEYSGGPEPANRFENPANSSRPKGLPSFESGASSRATGLPGKQNYDKK